MIKVIVFIFAVMVLSAFLLGCAATVYVPEAPPPPKAEMKPPAPGPKAVWLDGYWKWSHGRYVWAPGHWIKKPRGEWVSGHWVKRPRGWVWVTGYWRR
jgi:hypothetical protein